MAGRRKHITIEGAARAALSAPERVRRVFVPVAFAIGWCGVVGLLACAALALVPDESWPEALDPERLPLYCVLSLCVASLLGWGCVQHGEQRAKRTLGRPVALFVFLVLPVTAAALSLLDSYVLETPMAEWPGGFWIALFARWTAPTLVLVSLLTFLTWRTRPQKRLYLRRGLWFLVLVTPYALLLAVLLFDLPAPWVEEPVEESLSTVSESSIVLQLIVGYFVGDGSGD